MAALELVSGLIVKVLHRNGGQPSAKVDSERNCGIEVISQVNVPSVRPVRALRFVKHRFDAFKIQNLVGQSSALHKTQPEVELCCGPVF